MSFGLLMAVKISNVVFCFLTPCSLVSGYQRFERTYRLHLQVQVTSVLKMMDAGDSSCETLAATYKNTLHHNPRYHSRHGYHYVIILSYILMTRYGHI
jgi:hypothetical protein